MNVNERQRLDQRIRESPDLLADIIGSAMDAIIAVDDAQRIVLFNTAAEKIFVCPANEAIGSSVERFMPERFRSGHSTRVRRFAESGVTNRTFDGLGALWGLRATGEEFPIEASISKIESGGAKLFTAVIRDISERQRAEDARIRSAAIVESSDDAIIGTDVSGTVTDWNKGAERIFGYLASDAIGKHISFLTPTDHRDNAQHIFKKVINGEVVRHYETVRQRKDGTSVEVSLTVSPMVDSEGRVVGASGIARDITGRKFAEQELAAASDRLRLAIEAGSVGGWDFNLKTGKNVWFGKAHDQLGMAPEETLGSRQEFWDHVHEDDRERLEQALQASNEKREEFAEEFRVVWRDGTTHWLRSRGRYYYAPNGAPERMLGLSLDITERKEAEEALRESEQQFRLAAQAGRMYAYTWDVPTDVIVRSGNASGVLGSIGETPRTRQQTLARVHPDDRAIFNASVSQHTPEHPDVQISYRMLRPDGSVVWVEKTAHAMFDEQGRMVRVVGMVADITERKRAEETVRESEEKFRSVFREAGVGMVVVSPEGRFLAANGAFCDYLGYTEEELLAKTVESITFPEDWPAFSEKLSEALTGGCSFQWVQKRCLHKSGRIVHTESSASVIRSSEGHPQYFVAEVLNITERKEAEEALRESEQRFRLVANAAPVMIWMSGLDEKPTYFNQLWLDFTGLSETDLQNGLAGIVHPEDYQQCHDAYCRGFDQRQPFRKECRLRRHDGQYRWMLDIGVPRFHKDGSFAGYIGSCIDITDHKLAEEALSDMSRKLIAAQEQERARIARELHDDINQRLALLAIEIAQLRENPSEVENRIEELQNRVGEISHDVEGLAHDLHSSKLEHLGVVAGIKGWCREFAERQKMEINFSSDVLSVLPQEVGLSLLRVLQEALHNAMKYSGLRSIHVELREQSREAHLIVRDLGRGFDLEAALQGKGLGLTSMRERVRLVNGTISIESKPMGGTTIHVCVPLESERGSEQATG